MEAVLFVGLQASGKTTFYRERFFDTHVRISLDMLRTRHREQVLLEACLEAKQPFVVDNTNPTAEERAKYIRAAREAGFHVVGYYFQSSIEECKKRNETRPEGKKVPLRGVLGTYGKLQIPRVDEGFDALHYVKIDENLKFVIEDWSNEV